MGCSDSTQIIQNKPNLILKQPTTTSQNVRQWNFFIIGCLSQKQSIFCRINLSNYSINRMSIPQNYKAHNFLSMIQINEIQYFISGGINYSLSQITADCYIYNAKNHQVQKQTSMYQARYTHISILFNNQIYVFGGRYYGQDKTAILSKCQKFSLQNKNWIKLPQMNQKRCTGFSLIWNNLIYVFGGYTGPFQRSTKIQCLVENQSFWKILDFQLNRGIQSAIALSNKQNQIIIFGGLTNSGATSSVITLNFLQKSVISNRKIKQMRNLHKCFYHNKKMHIFGGDQNLSIQCYDLQTQTSTLIKNNINFAVQDFDNFGYSTKTIKVQYQLNNKIEKQIKSAQLLYIFGTTQQPFIIQIDIQNFQLRKYSVPLSIKLATSQGIVCKSEKQFILFGGSQDQDLSVALSQTYYYNHNKRQGKKLSNMNQSRYAFTYQFNKQSNCILVVGGATVYQNKKIYLDVCEKYYIKEQKWQIVSKFPKKLINLVSLTFKSQIYVFGGQNLDKQLNKNIFKYDFHKNKWVDIDLKLNINIIGPKSHQIFQDKFILLGQQLQTQQKKQQMFSLHIKQQNQLQIKNLVKIQNKLINFHMFKPKNQQFYVLFGGQPVLSFYQLDKASENITQIKSQKLTFLRQKFVQKTNKMNENNFEKYCIVSF